LRREITYHHVARGHNICPGTGLTNGLLAQLDNSHVVQNLAVLHDTVMALVAVGVERNVRAYHGLRVHFLDHTNRSGNDSVGVVSLNA
jgi:hypothetical protein